MSDHPYSHACNCMGCAIVWSRQDAEQQTAERIAAWLETDAAWQELNPDTHELENAAEAIRRGDWQADQ